MIQTRLLRWFKQQNRVLPWRGSKDPYRIWVSEVMLQQTTVGAVLPRYLRFLERFPDVAALASAPEESVVAEWSGLGYYSRARNLHRAARLVVDRHAGSIPSEPEALRELLAFGVPAPAADANVTRILSRLHAIEGPPASRAHRAKVLEAAARLLPERDPGDALAALMDLGQTICLPRRPLCGMCPLAEECAGLATGAPERFPERAAQAPVEGVFYAAAAAVDRGRVRLVRRPPGTWLAGTWAFPAAEGRSAAEARRALGRTISHAGFAVDAKRALGRARHTIMRRRFEIEVLPARVVARPPRAPEARWFTATELDRAAVSTLTRKIARAAGFLPAAGRAYP